MKSEKQIAQTTTQRQQTLKAKRKAQGLVRLELWVKSGNVKNIREAVKKLDK